MTAYDGIVSRRNLARTAADDKDHRDDLLRPLVPNARTGCNHASANPYDAQDCSCTEDHAAVATEHQSKC